MLFTSSSFHLSGVCIAASFSAELRRGSFPDFLSVSYLNTNTKTKIPDLCNNTIIVTALCFRYVTSPQQGGRVQRLEPRPVGLCDAGVALTEIGDKGTGGAVCVAC